MVRLRSTLLQCLTLFVASCRAGDGAMRDVPASKSNAPAVNEPMTKPAWSRRDWWGACRTNADCEKGQECLIVDPRPGQATSAASLPEPRACAIVIREPGLHDGPAFRHSYVGRLLLLPNVSIAFTDESCSLMECLEADGAPAECCNNCSGALVRLSGFSDVSVFAPDGERVQCAPRRDCDPPSCPSWTTSGKKFEIVGSFHTVHQDFAFQLASVPRAVN